MDLKTKHTPSARNIKLHIEELALIGLDPRDRFLIGDAVQREIAGLLAQEGAAGLPRRRTSIQRIDAGAFQVAPGSRGRDIGAGVAQSVLKSLWKPR